MPISITQPQWLPRQAGAGNGARLPMTTKKKSSRKPKPKPQTNPGKVAVMNISTRNVFTEFECLKPGDSGECSREVADSLIAKGLADEIG